MPQENSDHYQVHLYWESKVRSFHKSAHSVNSYGNTVLVQVKYTVLAGEKRQT